MLYDLKFSDLRKGNSRNNLWSVVKLVIVGQHKNILTCYIVTNVQPYVTFHGSINSTFSVSHQCLTHGHHFKTHKFFEFGLILQWQLGSHKNSFSGRILNKTYKNRNFQNKACVH